MNRPLSKSALGGLLVLSCVAVAALGSTTAHAFIYIGNPNLGFRVDRPAGDYVSGSAVLTKVRVHKCGGGYIDYPVGATVDPVAGGSVPIGAGDLCFATFYWGSVLEIEGPAYTLEVDDATTTVTLGSEIAPVALTPYEVVSGTMNGGGPWLLVEVD
jgi:hypothetical protein